MLCPFGHLGRPEQVRVDHGHAGRVVPALSGVSEHSPFDPGESVSDALVGLLLVGVQPLGRVNADEGRHQEVSLLGGVGQMGVLLTGQVHRYECRRSRVGADDRDVAR